MNASTADIEAWDRNADQYARMIGASEDKIYTLFKDVLWDSLGSLGGLTVLDVGCGHGWLTRLMLEAGANVSGIDGSTELLNKARRLCPQVEFSVWDLAYGLPAAEQRYDRIVAHMVLMDIPEINPLLKSVRHRLRETGKFIFTIPHPCFFNHKSLRDEASSQMSCRVTGYLQPEVWQIESFGGHRHYHRSLTDYFEVLRANHLAVTRLYEPPQLPYTAANDDFRQKIPKFMLIEAIPV